MTITASTTICMTSLIPRLVYCTGNETRHHSLKGTRIIHWKWLSVSNCLQDGATLACEVRKKFTKTVCILTKVHLAFQRECLLTELYLREIQC